MNDTDDESEKVSELTDAGDRRDGAPLEDALIEFLDAVDGGDVSKTLSVRDARLTALVLALEETDLLVATGTDLQEELGRDVEPDEIDRSEMLRLAIRLGLREAAPETLEAARNAYAKYASEEF